MWCISSTKCYVKNSKIISKPDNFKIKCVGDVFSLVNATS